MATDDRNPPPLKPHGDKLEEQITDLPEKQAKPQQDEQVKGGIADGSSNTRTPDQR